MKTIGKAGAWLTGKFLKAFFWAVLVAAVLEFLRYAVLVAAVVVVLLDLLRQVRAQ